MDKFLYELFDFQRFQQNAHLAGIIEDTEQQYGKGTEDNVSEVSEKEEKQSPIGQDNQAPDRKD